MLLIRAKSSLHRELARGTSVLPRRVHLLSRIDHRLGGLSRASELGMRFIMLKIELLDPFNRFLSSSSRPFRNCRCHPLLVLVHRA